MRWESGRRSDNIEDRRGMRIPGGFAGGGIGVVVIALIAMFFGVDPRLILEGAGQLGGSQPQQQVAPPDPAQDKLKDFVSVVLADTEDTWSDIFRRGNSQYIAPKLVLFTGAVQSACGRAGAPSDRSIARVIRRSTSTSISTGCWTSASARPAISPRPTSLHTRSDTTCRT